MILRGLVTPGTRRSCDSCILRQETDKWETLTQPPVKRPFLVQSRKGSTVGTRMSWGSSWILTSGVRGQFIVPVSLCSRLIPLSVDTMTLQNYTNVWTGNVRWNTLFPRFEFFVKMKKRYDSVKVTFIVT